MDRVAELQEFAAKLGVAVTVEKVPAGGYEMTFSNGYVQREKRFAQAKGLIHVASACAGYAS